MTLDELVKQFKEHSTLPIDTYIRVSKHIIKVKNQRGTFIFEYNSPTDWCLRTLSNWRGAM